MNLGWIIDVVTRTKANNYINLLPFFNLLMKSIFFITGIIALFLVSTIIHSETQAQQLISKQNTQSTSPNNKTAVEIITNHGEGNYTISDLMSTMMEGKCPLTGHMIDNNNHTGMTNLTDTIQTKSKPVVVCYI
jgi:hypothetical protein